MKPRFAIVMLGVVLTCGCNKSGSTTSPTTPVTGTTPAAPTTTDSFSGRLAVGDTQYFNFDVGVYGTVNVSVAAINGAGVPSTVQTRLGIGTPSDAGCTTTITALANPGVVGVTAAEQPGTYCATIADVGNLFAPADFTLTVAHP